MNPLVVCVAVHVEMRAVAEKPVKPHGDGHAHCQRGPQVVEASLADKIQRHVIYHYAAYEPAAASEQYAHDALLSLEEQAAEHRPREHRRVDAADAPLVIIVKCFYPPQKQGEA